jgi:hypothetical protein
MKNRLVPLALSTAFVLSACGGGGGDSGSTPTPAPVSTMSVVTSANANKVARNAYAGSTVISDSSSSLSGFLTGVSVGQPSIGVVRPALDLIRHVYPRTAGQLLTGVTMTEACSGGGSITIDANLSNSQMASNGDTITIAAKNCVEDGDTINGSLSIKMSNISGDVFNSWNWSATLDSTFTGFTVSSGADTLSVNGDMKIALTQTNSTTNSMSLSGKSLQTSVQRSGASLGTVTLADFSMTGSTRGTTVTTAANFAMSGSSSALGQFSYTVRNLQPFVSTGGATPSSGSLIVNGAASSVTLTVVPPTGVRLDFSAKGDGVTTQTTNLSWTELLASL